MSKRRLPVMAVAPDNIITVWVLAYDTDKQGTGAEMVNSESKALDRWLDLLGVEDKSTRRRFRRSWLSAGDDAYQSIIDEYAGGLDTYSLDSQRFTLRRHGRK